MKGKIANCIDYDKKFDVNLHCFRKAHVLMSSSLKVNRIEVIQFQKVTTALTKPEIHKILVCFILTMLAQGIIRDIEDWEDVIIVFAQVERVRYFSTTGSHFAHVYQTGCQAFSSPLVVLPCTVVAQSSFSTIFYELLITLIYSLKYM